MPTAFEVPANNIVATVGSGGYTTASGTLVLAAGLGGKFPALTGQQFYRITVVQQAHAYDPLMSAGNYTIFKATSLSGDTFSGVAVIEGTVDRNYVSGDVVDVRVTAGTIGDIQTAIGNLETLGRLVCTGRLTLVSGTPLATNNAGATVYFTPYLGNLISLYNGTTGWDTIGFTEQNIAVPGVNGLYDVWGWNNAGVLALELSTKWDTTGASAADGVRHDALTTQDGILVKSGASTRRYLGTFYAVSSNTNDTYQNRWVWNATNRVLKKLKVTEAAGSWTYTSTPTAWRSANNNANGLSFLQTVRGFADEAIQMKCQCGVSLAVSTAAASLGIGYDNSSVSSSDVTSFNQNTTIATSTTSAILLPNLGLHTIWSLESVSGGTATFYGASYQAIFGLYKC